jgi:hypothetical protein
MSIINDKEIVETTNQYERSISKKALAFSRTKYRRRTTTLTTKMQKAKWITQHLVKPYSQLTI